MKNDSLDHIIKNIKMRIKSLEISINNLQSYIDKNRKVFGDSSYCVGFQKGERENSIYMKECLEDLLKMCKEELELTDE